MTRLILLQRNARVTGSSGTEELDGIFSILDQRKPKGHRRIGLGPEVVKANEWMSHTQVGNVTVSLKALSPSSEDIHRARQDFAQELGAFKEAKRRAVSFGPNYSSIVLRLTAGERAVLMGADREVTANQRTGWSVILDDEVGPRGPALAYKVPHHGSANGDRDEIWEELLIPSPICLLTPYRSSGLPKDSDIARLKGRADAVYLTAPRRGSKPQRGDRTVDKMMRLGTRERRQLRSELGQIRLRFDVGKTDAEPEIELSGTARAC